MDTKKKSKKARTVFKFTIAAVILCAAIGTIILLGAQRLNDPPASIPVEGVVFRVEDGDHLNGIVNRLDEQGLIRSPLFVKGLSYLRGTQGAFQAGSYLVTDEMSSLAIHDLLVSGQEVLTRITVPEGWTIRQVAERLENNGIVSAVEFIESANDTALLDANEIVAANAEGYLFPDTYLFPQNFPAEQVVQVMIDRFYTVLGEIGIDADELAPADLHEKIVLASIIEREYRDIDEAPLMASVFYNRLDVDMKLQSCATVAYVMTEELGMEYPEVLTFDDLEIPSNYNTYWSRGLPPGPIANPGSTSLRAAFFPAESDFLYFVLKDSDAGKHEFTRSFDEHLYAKNLFLKKG